MAGWPLRSPCRELSWEVSSWKEINGSRDGPRILTDKRVQNWCRRGESNPRPRDYETLALPLSYAGMTQFFMLRIRLRTCQGVAQQTDNELPGETIMSSPNKFHDIVLSACWETRLAAITRAPQKASRLPMQPSRYYNPWYHGTVDPYSPKTYPSLDRTLSHLSG
jgi:hypothetical protein